MSSLRPAVFLSCVADVQLVMTVRWLAPLVAAVAVAITGSAAVHASCGVSDPPPSVADQVSAAKVVFVGSVIYTTDNNRTARVKVEAIWKGPRLPANVDVHGEAPGSGPFSGSEADHQFQSGRQYLFFPLNDQPPFQDYGDCNISTQPYTTALAADAPPRTLTSNPPTVTEMFSNVVGQYLWPITVLGLLVVAVLSILILNFRRRAKLPTQFGNR
jgi:hypothetical protein